MRSVLDIRDIYTLPEYMATLEDSAKRERIRDAFAIASPMFVRIKKHYRSTVPIPEIRIVVEPTPVLETMGDRIRMHSGFLDALFENNFIDPKDVFGIAFPQIFLDTLSICWVLAHEYFHEMRGHRFVSDAGTEADETAMAFEYDADCCATAALFRESQLYFRGKISDATLRGFCLYIIYRTLRLLPDAPNSPKHPAFASRLWSALTKLGSLNEAPEDQTYPLVSDAATDARQLEICKVLVRLEQIYLSVLGLDFQDHAIFNKWDHDRLKHVMKWGEIRILVEAQSGTRA